MKTAYCAFLILTASLLLSETFISGIWVHGYNHGYLTPGEAQRMVDFCHEHNINTIFMQVRKSGDAYYESSKEPRATNIEEGYNPLPYVLDLASQKDPPLSIHAWMVMNKKGTRAQEEDLCHSHILARKPECIMRRSNGSTIWIDPALPDVQQYQAEVVQEIIKEYPELDGIHLDYIRYPDIDAGYSEPVLQQYMQETRTREVPSPDDPGWSRWRRDRITQQVRKIYWTIQQVDPTILLSIAASCNDRLPESTSIKISHFQQYVQRQKREEFRKEKAKTISNSSQKSLKPQNRPSYYSTSNIHPTLFQTISNHKIPDSITDKIKISSLFFHSLNARVLTNSLKNPKSIN